MLSGKARIFNLRNGWNIRPPTVAPTGTLSMLAQTSSGIEPVFMTHYKRRRKLNEQDRDAKVDFIDDSGDKWQEFISL